MTQFLSPHTNPIEELIAEHRAIERVAAAMDAMADRLSAGGDVPVTNLTRLGEFLQVFADQCHHGKEEASLFPMLEALGVPATGCPLGGLIGEHQKGRLLVSDLMQASATYGGDANAAREQVTVILRALSQFYKNHIWKEDNLLFPLAEKLLPTAEAESLLGAFRRVEQEIGVERLSELAEFVAELERS